MIRVRKRVPFFVKKRWRSLFMMDTCSLSSESDRPPRTDYTFYGLPPGMEEPNEHPLKYEGRTDDSYGDRHYNYISGNERMKFPSVTTVLEKTIPNGRYFALRNWEKGSVDKHGKEGHKKLRETILNEGIEFHSILNDRLAGLVQQREGVSPPSTSLPPSQDNPYMKSIESVLVDITDVMLREEMIVHSGLGYGGTVDCVARYKGDLCAIDWKTSRKEKPNSSDLYDYPLQTVAYAGAINTSSCYPFKINGIMVAIAYESGQPAHVHYFDSIQCEAYWEKWLDRLEQYQTQFAHDTSTVYSGS